MTLLHEVIAPKDNADDAVLVQKNYFNNWDKVSKGDEIISLETSKTTMSIEAPSDGYIEYLVESGDEVDVGEVIVKIHDEPTANNTSKKANETNSSTDIHRSMVYKQLVSKKAQKIIDQNNIDITSIKKTFITSADLIGSGDNSRTAKPVKLASLEAGLDVIARPLTLAKKMEIAALSTVQSTGLVSTIFMNIEAVALPASSNLLIKTAGPYLTLIAHEVSQLLRDFPLLNAYFENDQVFEYKDVNLGIAIDKEDGLKVYSIKNSDKLSPAEIEKEIAQGIYLYFRKRLTLDQIKGSTFTITDLSSTGVDRFVPLINYKQSAILGIAAVDPKLKRFTVCLSFDHRATEGKVASQFLKELAARIEAQGEKTE